MFRALAAAALCCLLASCSTTSTLNASIAQTSATLSKQCSTVGALIAIAETRATRPKVQRALAAAEAARAAFCAAPPSDTASAVLTLGVIILNVQTALKA